MTDAAALEALAREDLRIKLRASYLILLQSCLDLESLPVMPSGKRTLSAVKRVAAERFNAGEELLGTLRESRRELIGALQSLTALRVYQSIVNDFILQEIFVFRAPPAPEKNVGALLSVHLDALAAKPDAGGNKDAADIDFGLVSEFIAMMPLRMTSGQYYGYVRDALYALDHEPDYEEIDDYERLFYPVPYLERDRFFPEQKAVLDGLWLKSGPSENLGEANARYEKVKEVQTALTEALKYTTVLFDAVDAAYIVLRYGNLYGKSWKDPEMALLRDTFVRVENLTQTERAAFARKLGESVHLAVQGAHFGPLDDAFDQIADMDAQTEDFRKFCDDWGQVHELFYETGMDYHTANRLKRVGEPTSFADFAGSLTDYMEKCAEGLPVNRKCFLRQHFLSNLPYPYDLKAYRKYFLDTYDSLDDAGKALVALYVAYTTAGPEGITNADSNV